MALGLEGCEGAGGVAQEGRGGLGVAAVESSKQDSEHGLVAAAAACTAAKAAGAEEVGCSSMGERGDVAEPRERMYVCSARQKGAGVLVLRKNKPCYGLA